MSQPVRTADSLTTQRRAFITSKHISNILASFRVVSEASCLMARSLSEILMYTNRHIAGSQNWVGPEPISYRDRAFILGRQKPQISNEASFEFRQLESIMRLRCRSSPRPSREIRWRLRRNGGQPVRFESHGEWEP